MCLGECRPGGPARAATSARAAAPSTRAPGASSTRRAPPSALPRSPRPGMRAVVAELREEVARDRLEERRVVGSHLLAPGARVADRRLGQARMVGVERRVLAAVVLEHAGLVLEVEERADLAEVRLRLLDEVFVAELVVRVGAAERLRAPHLTLPRDRQLADEVRARPRRAPPRERLKRGLRVIASSETAASRPSRTMCDVARVRERPVEHVEVLHVERRLVARSAACPATRRRAGRSTAPPRRSVGSLGQPRTRLASGSTPHSRETLEPAEVLDERVALRPLAVPVPELREEVRLARDRELRVRVEHRLQERGAAPGDAEDDGGCSSLVERVDAVVARSGTRGPGRRRPACTCRPGTARRASRCERRGRTSAPSASRSRRSRSRPSESPRSCRSRETASAPDPSRRRTRRTTASRSRSGRACARSQATRTRSRPSSATSAACRSSRRTSTPCRPCRRCRRGRTRPRASSRTGRACRAAAARTRARAACPVSRFKA